MKVFQNIKVTVSNMEAENKCICCHEKVLPESAKFSIFQRDSLLKKCLVYKIDHITGLDTIYESHKSFLCSQCRDLLVQIHFLEQQFVRKFQSYKNQGEIKSEDVKLIENIQPGENNSFETRNENFYWKAKEEINNLNQESETDKNEFQEFPHEEFEADLKNNESEKDLGDGKGELDSNSNDLNNNNVENVPKSGRSEDVADPIEWSSSKLDTIKEDPLTCKICLKTCPNKMAWYSHVRRHNKKLKCENCDFAFSNKRDFQRHLRVHTGERPFPCDLCGKGFRDKFAVRKHKTIMHENPRSFLCAICKKHFVQKGSFIKHQQLNHKESLLIGVEPLENELESVTVNPDKVMSN